MTHKPWTNEDMARSASLAELSMAMARTASQFAGDPGFNLLDAPQSEEGEPIIVTAARRYNRAFTSLRDRAVDAWFDFWIPEACCFTAGTLVSTPSGLKAIETLKVGDLVISRDHTTGETAAKPIVCITPAHERHIWTVTVSYKGDDGRWRDEVYETTDDHPWRTTDGRWIASASLTPGLELARESGTAVVAAVADTGATKLTYNLEIADFHTYFVGEAGTWVHNDCFPKFPTDPSQLGHIFRNAPGHFSQDTPEAREMILGATRNFSHVNRFGNAVYGAYYPGQGVQVWVVARNGVIQNAGYNTTPQDLTRGSLR